MELSRKIMNICQETGANYNTIEDTVKKLRELNNIYIEKSRIMTEQILNSIKFLPSYKSGPGIVSGTFIGLLDQQIKEFARRKTSEANLVVVIANLGVESDSLANLVLARSKSLKNIDCNKLFREISSECAKGGGKPEFVNGVIKREYMCQFVNAIIGKIQTYESI
jgi:alanyl-tRNA synthetase